MQNLLHATSEIGLHDCWITKLTWSSDDDGGMRLDMDIFDFWADHYGLPSYGGPTTGTISLLDVQAVDISLKHNKNENSSIWIYHFDVTEHEKGGFHAEIGFSPGGRIGVHFMDSICPKLELPAC